MSVGRPTVPRTFLVEKAESTIHLALASHLALWV